VPREIPTKAVPSDPNEVSLVTGFSAADLRGEVFK
jgi:hypothetical protein